MQNLIYKIQRWFDLNLSWFFINARKQEAWCEHLKEKYPEDYQKSIK